MKLTKTPSDYGKNEGIWMGGLLYPEAFMTASRQQVAQVNEWSLEDLNLVIEIGQQQADKNEFIITGN